MDMTLATLNIGGAPRKVLLHAPKNGFFYVIDRENGKLISAEKLGKVTWATKVDMATGRPVLTPNARYENGPVTLWPSFQGVHNLYPQSFSPKTGLVYVPTIEMPAQFGGDVDYKNWHPLPSVDPVHRLPHRRRRCARRRRQEFPGRLGSGEAARRPGSSRRRARTTAAPGDRRATWCSRARRTDTSTPTERPTGARCGRSTRPRPRSAHRSHFRSARLSTCPSSPGR